MQHFVDALFVATGQNAVSLHAPPPRCRLLVAVVTAPGFAMPDLSTAGALEALGSSFVRFHLWHCDLLCLFGLVGVVDFDFHLVAVNLYDRFGLLYDRFGLRWGVVLAVVLDEIVKVVIGFGFQLGRHVG